MNKLFALAAVPMLALSLAACGGDTDEPTEATIDDSIAAPTAGDAPLPATSPGTYTSTADDGSTMVVSLNADGSYTLSNNGEQVEAGSWEDNIRGTCMTATGAAEACYNIRPGADAGMVDITGPDGVTMSYRFEG